MVSLFSSISIILVIFIPQLMLAVDNNIEFLLNEAKIDGADLFGYPGIQDAKICSLTPYVALEDLKRATEKYEEGKFEDFVKWLDSAIEHIKICQDSGEPKDINGKESYNVFALDLNKFALAIKAVKKEALSKLKIGHDH